MIISNSGTRIDFPDRVAILDDKSRLYGFGIYQRENITHQFLCPDSVCRDNKFSVLKYCFLFSIQHKWIKIDSYDMFYDWYYNEKTSVPATIR